MHIHLKALIAVAAAVLILAASGTAVFELTKKEIPSLKDKDLVSAKETLLSDGFKDKHIIAYDSASKKLGASADERYIIVSQEPEAGKKIHSFEDIKVVCEDSYAKFDEDIEGAVNERYSTGEEIAEENDYSVTLYKEEDGSLTPENGYISDTEKEDFIVTRVYNIDHKNKTLCFAAVSEKDTQEKWTDVLDDMKNENASEAVDAITDEGYDFELSPVAKDKYADKCDMTTGKDFLVVGPGDIDVQNKTIELKVVSLKQKAFEKKEKKLLKKLKSKIPYVGLSEDYVNKTKIGKADKYTEKGDNDEKHVYKWRSDDGDYTPLIVTCIGNKVTKVTKKYKYAFWKNANMPDFSVDKDAVDAKRTKYQKTNDNSTSLDGSSFIRGSGSDTMVWVPRTGSKYHSNPNCSGMRNPTQMPLSEAKKYYGACKKCYG